jgi:hypothetical protein
VYAEGGDLGYSNNTGALWPYFGASYLGDGNASGNVSQLTGQVGSFAEGFGFDYPHQQGPDSWVDILGAAAGAVLLSDQSGTCRAVFHQADGYRTVCSSVIFGAFGAEDRASFLAAAMDFLTVGTGAAEPRPPAPATAVVAEPNPVRLGSRVRFTVPAGAKRLAVFDASGRTVLVRDGGSDFDWDLRGSSGSPVVPGSYFVRVTGPGLVSSYSLAVVR